MGNLLMEYIRLALREARLARVPQQLMPLSTESGTEEDGNEENVQEFSGAIAGYTAPLGMSPDRLGRKKNRPRRKK